MPNNPKNKGLNRKSIDSITGLVFKTGRGNSEVQVSLSFYIKTF
ncbi:hypothetical protein AQPE_0438 [Aquipluma nitroreducens]|uniref:Uncharacterized protein n=1 Tax=Aquipluma nitroreducens TaxID=2010828 RepID=A0A5K7S406_9BACT|nr:hypothetical protein AQPE_0438 [Aquipluma nitroreducens]